METSDWTRIANREKSLTEKYPDLFRNNTTTKGAEINILMKRGHYPVKQNARSIPLHLQEAVGNKIE